jgi:hypothetical protein
LILHLCPELKFPSRVQISQEILPGLVEKIGQMYVLPTLIKCHFAIASFDMWMSEKTYDVFTLVINFWGNDW